MRAMKNYDEDLDCKITMSEVKDAIYSQIDNKSSGNDSLIAEIYKHSFPFISHIILELFNRIFESRIIVPIFKGGDINETKNTEG